MAGSRSTVQRVAGALVAVPFVVLGAQAARDPAHRTALAARLGLPAPEASVRLNGAAMVAGGIGLATGVRRREAALGLVASLVPTTVAGHRFWEQDDALAAKLDRIAWMKNIGLAGAALAVGFADGSER